MTFNAVFRRAIPPVFDKVPSAAVTTSWWLSGGISAANCVAAYQPKGAASLAASYINLASPGTYNAAPGTAPTWDAVNGWIFNGLTQYLRTGVIPINGYSMIIQYSNAGTSTNGALAGNYDGGSKRFYVVPRQGDAFIRYGYNGGTNISPRLLAGNIGLTPGSGYRNGLLDGVITSGALHNIEIFVGGFNLAGELSQPLDYYCQALVIYNISINATQMSALNTAMNAL